MVVPQQALLKQAGVQVLAFEANLTAGVNAARTANAAVLGPDAAKALAYQRYFDRNVALVWRLKIFLRHSACRSITVWAIR